MLSTDMTSLASWKRWNSNLPKSAPDFPGIYAFRMAGGRAVERLIGSSDILYIGCSKDSTIRKRLSDHYRTNDRLQRVLKEVGEIEISWQRIETDHEVRLWESDLIARYEREHIELPPLNRTQPWATLQKAKLLLKELPPEVERAMSKVAEDHGYCLYMFGERPPEPKLEECQADGSPAVRAILRDRG